jgi:uncharacterized membrane protein
MSPTRRIVLEGAVALLLLVALAPVLSAAPEQPPPAADAALEIVDVQDVTPTETAEPSLVATLSRFHAALVHFPIAWLFLLVLVDLGTFVGGRPWQQWGFLLGIGTVLTAIVAVVTGLVRSQSMPVDAAMRALIETHERLAITTTSLTAAAVLLRVISKNQLPGARRWLYLALLMTAALLIGLTGHMGGKIVFGADFLPF